MNSELSQNHLQQFESSGNGLYSLPQQRNAQFYDFACDQYYSLENMIRRGRQPKIVVEQPLSREEEKKLESLSEALKECYKLRKTIEEHPFGYFFKYPVNPYKLGLDDYWRVVKRPIDLTTIKRKFLTGLYVKAAQFNQDMRLMFSNALTYNEANNQIQTRTNELLGLYQKQYSQIQTLISQNRLSQKFQDSSSSSSFISKLTSTQVVSIFNQTRKQKLGRLLSFLNNRKKRSLLATMKKKYNDLPVFQGENTRIYFNKLSASQIYDLLKLAKNITSIDFDTAKLMNFRREPEGQNLENSQNRGQEEVESEFEIEDEEDE